MSSLSLPELELKLLGLRASLLVPLMGPFTGKAKTAACSVEKKIRKSGGSSVLASAQRLCVFGILMLRIITVPICFRC